MVVVVDQHRLEASTARYDMIDEQHRAKCQMERVPKSDNTTQADPAWAQSVLVPGGTWREHEKAQPHKSRVWLCLVAGPARRSSEIEIGKGGGGQA